MQPPSRIHGILALFFAAAVVGSTAQADGKREPVKQYRVIFNGDVTGFPTSLNFSVPQVRALKFRVIGEIFRKYDFDGLEIDFLRSAPYFLPGEEAKHAHLVTERRRRVRKHLIERGTQRGRPIRRAARVEGSLASCRKDGSVAQTAW